VSSADWARMPYYRGFNMFGVFQVVDCCGKPLDIIKIPVNIDYAWRDIDGKIDDFTFCLDYRPKVLHDGGFDSGRCGQCGDDAYRVKLLHFIDSNGKQVELCDA